MNISLSAFAPDILVLRDGFGSPVPRQRTSELKQQQQHIHTHKHTQERTNTASNIEMARMSGSDCAVIYINTVHTHDTYVCVRGYVQYVLSAHTRTHTHC